MEGEEETAPGVFGIGAATAAIGVPELWFFFFLNNKKSINISSPNPANVAIVITSRMKILAVS